MSETANKATDSENSSKNSGRACGPETNSIREKCHRDFKKDWRSNSNYKRNRSSYHAGYRKDDFGLKPFKRNWSNFQQDGGRKKLKVGNRLKESDVSITEYIGDQGFSGVIKERYTDFHVNEIALDGEIAKLTNQDIPPQPEDNENLEDLKSSVPDTIWDQLQTLKDAETSSIEIDVTNMDKDQRRAIHAIAKKMTDVVSQTIDRDNKKIMMIFPGKKDNRDCQTFQRDNRKDWKNRDGEYCYFLLHKVNMDTMDALNQLAMNLRMKPNNFNYAGMKDRRAWTTQWVSLRKVEPSVILRAAKCVRGAYVGNFKFVKEPLKLGMLSGNHFRIALRNVSGTDEQIEQTMTSLRDRGFINYYGLQRFGTVAAIPTYEIGKTLLQGKWNEAIELILKPREGEQDRDLVEARKVYELTKDAYAAYKKIKRSDKIEATLLKGIYTSGSNNPQGALDSVPRNTRLMYIHAYQSYVWNHMVSRRIKEFGTKPIVGDLVYENNTKQRDQDEAVYDNDNERAIEDTAESIENTDKLEDESCANTVKEDEVTEVPTESTSTSIKEITSATESCLKIDENTDKSKTTAEENEPEDLYNLSPVKILTEEDLPNYTLADVLMPQVGWKVTYPPYAKPWFDEFLAKDGLTTDLRQKNKKYSLGGTYRKILQIPSNLSWKIMHYKEKHSDLIMCDIDEMRKSTAPKDEPEGQYKALIIEMSLKSSTYATMALREILKFDTSPQAQAAQYAACNTEVENSNDSPDVTQSENSAEIDNTDNDEKCSKSEGQDANSVDEIKDDKTETPDAM